VNVILNACPKGVAQYSVSLSDYESRHRCLRGIKGDVRGLQALANPNPVTRSSHSLGRLTQTNWRRRPFHVKGGHHSRAITDSVWDTASTTSCSCKRHEGLTFRYYMIEVLVL